MYSAARRLHLLRRTRRPAYNPAAPHAALATTSSSASRAAAATDSNYFRLLGLPETFALDAPTLSARFRALQAEWHPDKFATRPKTDQLAAADMSARINAAHDALTRPHRRARHLLALRHPSVSPDDVHPSADFLAWVMSFREDVEHAAARDPALLARLREQLRTRHTSTVDSLAAAFKCDNMHDAALATAKLQYIHSIASAIDDVPLD